MTNENPIDWSSFNRPKEVKPAESAASGPSMADLLEGPIETQWRPQGRPEKGQDGNWYALGVPYIDAGAARSRLNHVFGPVNWKAEFTIEHEYQEEGKGNRGPTFVCVVGCRISVWNELVREWVPKSDTGHGRGDTMEDARKAAYSDSEKRAAGQWGVGRYLDSLDRSYFQCVVDNRNYFLRWEFDPPQGNQALSQGNQSQPQENNTQPPENRQQPPQNGGNGQARRGQPPKREPEDALTPEQWRGRVMKAFEGVGKNELESFFGPLASWDMEKDRPKFVRLRELLKSNPSMEFGEAAEIALREFAAAEGVDLGTGEIPDQGEDGNATMEDVWGNG